MKKILAMAAIALFMVSCSDDDSDNTQSDTKLTKVVTTDSDGVVTSNLTYDGNKLIAINSSDSEKQVITYTGNLVTEWKTFDDDNQMIDKDIYQYNAQNQLVTYYELYYDAVEGNEGYKTIYTHNADGTISFTEYSGDDVDDLNSFTEKKSEGTITDTTITTIYNTGEDTEVVTYTFDGKNNPLKNVTGMDKIGFAGTSGSKKFFTENVVSQTYSYNNSTPVVENTKAYTYNSDNFPLTETKTETGGSGSISTIQYTYE